MLGLKVKVVSTSRDGLIAGLQEVIESLKSGDNNAFIPLNDENKTEADYDLVQRDGGRWNGCGIYDEWLKS